MRELRQVAEELVCVPEAPEHFGAAERERVTRSPSQATSCFPSATPHSRESEWVRVCFPQVFSLVLRAHSKNVSLFETQRSGPYTVRRVQQIVQQDREAVGPGETVHPHFFRPQMLTVLTGQKLSDARVQPLRGSGARCKSSTRRLTTSDTRAPA